MAIFFVKFLGMPFLHFELLTCNSLFLTDSLYCLISWRRRWLWWWWKWLCACFMFVHRFQIRSFNFSLSNITWEKSTKGRGDYYEEVVNGQTGLCRLPAETYEAWSAYLHDNMIPDSLHLPRFKGARSEFRRRKQASCRVHYECTATSTSSQEKDLRY